MAGEPYDYFGAMGGAANIGGVPQAVNSAILGQQQVQNNQAVLDQQQRANDARTIQGVLVANPNMDDAHFDALTNHLATIDPAAAQAAKIARQEKMAVAEWAKGPTARSTAILIATHPGVSAQMEKPWAMMDAAQKEATLRTTADVYGHLQAGNTDAAIQILQNHMESAQRTGEDVSAYPQLIQTIRTNPKGALGLAALNLAAGMGKEKFAEVYGKVNPAIQAQEEAKAKQEGVKAEFAPVVAQSDLATAEAQRQRMRDQTANEQADLAIKREGLTLERDKLVSNIQLELQKLDSTGVQLDGGTRQRRDAAVGESVASQGLANRMLELADQMGSVKPASGWKAAFYEKAKGTFGSQDEVTGLRAQYNILMNSQAAKNLPPGSASDADMRLAKQGFPPDTANAAYLASFLRGMAKIQALVANTKSAEATWMSSTGGLGPLRRDTDINGVTVPAGTTFLEFTRNQYARSKQGEPSPSLRGIFDKYGGR